MKRRKIKSKTEARNLIRQKAVEIDGEKVLEDLWIDLSEPRSFILRIGKRHFVKVIIGA